ncbi:hypothetical protein B4135_2963 [Caldibacillus debilis]|uniref:Uncharacterized protein n=1 Tax=Caldibacillus debilis TaxID=301148 RepID=A0A150LMP2_9BACI|nr:hypothetical protein B4135_2963 [Caldibacillus debilis]
MEPKCPPSVKGVNRDFSRNSRKQAKAIISAAGRRLIFPSFTYSLGKNLLR